MASRQMPEVQPTFNAELLRVVDADTISVRLDKHHGDQSTKTLRLLGIDAPELRAEAGKAARDFAVSFLVGPLVVQTAKQDKYGRWLAYVWRKSDGAELGSALREAGHAHAVSVLAQMAEARGE